MIPQRSEFVTNGVPLFDTQARINCDYPAIVVTKDQLWQNSGNITVTVRDYDGAPVPEPFQIFVLLQLSEEETSMERTFYPSSKTLQEHPVMLENSLALWAN
jgi:hypothetical protein